MKKLLRLMANGEGNGQCSANAEESSDLIEAILMVGNRRVAVASGGARSLIIIESPKI